MGSVGSNFWLIAAAASLFLAVPVQSATVVTGTLTITNAANINATNAYTITVNGSARTWTNAVYSASTQILASTNNATAVQAALVHFAAYPVSGLQLLSDGATYLSWRGSAVTVDLSTNTWSAVSYSTNTTAEAMAVRIPYTIESAANQTNIANGLMDWLNSAANTNKLDASKVDITPGGTTTEVAGWVTLTNGAAVVASTNVSTNSLIFLSRMAYTTTNNVAVQEDLNYRTNGASFKVVSADTNDTAHVAWKLLTLGAISSVPSAPVSQYYTPFAYYRMDDATPGSGATDVVGTNTLTSAYGTPTASVSGIITNAFNLDNWSLTNNASGFEFSGGDWCVRFWIKAATVYNGSLMDRTGGSDGWEIRSYNGGGSQYTTLDGYGSGGNVSFTANATRSTGAWHRIVVYHQHGVGVGIKIDNNATETDTWTYTMISSSVPITVGNSAKICTIDEIAFWKGYIPSEEELTTDWNGGAGVTYPFP